MPSESSSSTFRFYGQLNDFLPVERRGGHLSAPVRPHQTAKDVIEALGVPHPEVGLVLVDGRPVGLDHRLAGGERVAVYPPFTGIEVPADQRLDPPIPDPPRFLLDGHLGRLARNLRLAGLDTSWSRDAEDDDLARLSAEQGRVLLTRDVGLLKRARVTHGYWVRAVDPDQQTTEVLRRYDLFDQLQPFTRCPRCNGLLEAVRAEEVQQRLQAGTRATYTDFQRCRSCGQVYWQGAHHRTLLDRVERWRRSAPNRVSRPG